MVDAMFAHNSKQEVRSCMQVTSSYGVEIRKQNIPIRHTLRIYRSAVSYLIQVYTEAWGELSEISNAKKRFNDAEHLVHGTKKNQADVYKRQRLYYPFWRGFRLFQLLMVIRHLHWLRCVD